MNSDKAILFLLKSGFSSAARGEGRFFCRTCVELAGLIEAYPQLKSHVEVRPVDFARPRKEIVELIGEENQGCPVLVLPAGASIAGLAADIGAQEAKGRGFVEGVESIERYFAHAYGIDVAY